MFIAFKHIFNSLNNKVMDDVKYYEKYKTELLEYQKEYYNTNKKERIEYQKQYNLKNRSKNLDYQRKYIKKSKRFYDKSKREAIEPVNKYDRIICTF